MTVHRYQPLWKNGPDREIPSPTAFTFRDAEDVGRFAALDPLTTWYSYPQFWHLDDQGRWRCCSEGSSLDSLMSLAEQPGWLMECRLEDVGHRCPDFWVMLSPRQKWADEGYEPHEGDVAAFVELRRWFASEGVRLLDALVLTDDYRWWSMHELTSGSTAWSFTRPEGETNQIGPIRKAGRR